MKWLFLLTLFCGLQQKSADCFSIFGMSSWRAHGGSLCLLSGRGSERPPPQLVQQTGLIGAVALRMKKRDRRRFVILECTEARMEGKPPSRYTTTKNRRNTPEPLQLRKYNKFLKRHTIHKELK